MLTLFVCLLFLQREVMVSEENSEKLEKKEILKEVKLCNCYHREWERN